MAPIMRLLVSLPLLAACASSPAPDAPFTGEVHRYAIDRFDLPASNAEARQLGDDLNGDHTADNQIGQVTATLTGEADLAPNPSDLRNLLPTAIEINAHDLSDDDHVGVSYIGRPGDVSTPATGTFSGGVFVSERSRDTAHPANGAMVLPIFVDADPTEFPLQHGEIDLQPDGSGGYTGQLRGVIDPEVAAEQAAISTYQMLRSNPHDHLGFADLLTRDIFSDKPPVAVTLANIKASTLFTSLLAPDVSFGGTRWLSFGFQFHLVPCDAGTCAPVTVIDHCDDRIQDLDETDIDCGGSCHACGFDSQCLVAADCQSGACDTGMCREPSCSDGIQDGFETGVDCGTYGCSACAGG
jgi:hypothetical protein